MRAAPAVAIALMLTVPGCGPDTERTLLTQFFAASRLRDLTALGKISTVVFEPATDGIVTSFDITGVIRRGPTEQVAIAAPVKMFDGRVVMKNFAVTVDRGVVTAINETAASPSTPRP
jgi:hypothetical protein